MGYGIRRGAHGPRPSAYSVVRGEGVVVALAIHSGHHLRPEVASVIAIDRATRLREEDPHTGAWTAFAPTRVVVHRSRFEVDLNRPRDGAVYQEPGDAWGIDVWDGRPPPDLVQGSLALYDAFYRELDRILGTLVVRWGGALVYDLHSYNHEREGPGLVAPQWGNPDVNLGTGALDRERWAPVIDAFLEVMGRCRVRGRPLDVRENVRFEGGHLVKWIAGQFPGSACPLAIEVKKTFMDEWTGALDREAHRDFANALARSVPVAEQAFHRVRGTARPARRLGASRRRGGT